MIPFPHRLTTGLAAFAACIALVSCNSTKTASNDDGLIDYTTQGSTARPVKLPKEEYPFDEAGNYREDWAAQGAGVRGVRDTPTDTALYTQASDSGPVNHPAYTPDDTPVRDAYVSSSPGSSSSSSPTPRKTSASSSSGTKRTTSGSRTASRSGSSSKSKAKARPTSKPTVVKVKPGDTLYGLSRKYGVSVATIKSANGLKSDTIVDGKPLRIPKRK